jgi:inosine triphosphate pyrophosphatase
MLKFISGNKWKFGEMEEIFKPVKIQWLNVELDEIQDIDPYVIIRHKLNEAFKHQKGNFFIEDTSTYYHALKNQLPGPFMKWFLEVLGSKGLYEFAKKLGNTKAEMRTIIAYAKNKKLVYFFEGITKGQIVKPKGGKGFGLDPIFKPTGVKFTLAELKKSGLTSFSARYRAATKFKKFLLKQSKNEKH